MNDSIDDLIRRRYSCRKYTGEPLAGETRELLESTLASIEAGPLGTRVRLVLIAATDQDRDSLKGLGTYGSVKAPPAFIVGAIEQGPKNLEEYGHCLERAVLAATGLGLQTCWLGGSFTKSAFARKVAATVGETVPAVVAVGYPTSGSRDTWVRERAGSKHRLPHERLFFLGTAGVPLSPSSIPEYSPVLEAMRWAPSASNKQPWRVVKSDGVWRFYLERTKGYGKGTAAFTLLRLADLQRVDMGIAMCHFELSAGQQDLHGRWVVEEEPTETELPNLEYTAGWVEDPSVTTEIDS